MDERNGTKIWENPTDKKIDGLIEEGIEILKRETQKSLKEFDLFVKSIIGEEDILR